VTLRLRDNRIAGALRAAGSKSTKCAKRATLHGVVAERRASPTIAVPATTFSTPRRVTLVVQSPARAPLGPDGEGVGLLLAQIFLEFFVVGLGDLFPAGDEGVDRGSCSVQRSARRFDWGRRSRSSLCVSLSFVGFPISFMTPPFAVRPLVLCEAFETSVLLGRAGYRFLLPVSHSPLAAAR